MNNKFIIKRVAIQLISNGIILLNNNKIAHHLMSSVENYKVINRKEFMKTLKIILEKNQIETSNEKINISIIIDKTYIEADKKNLINIFRFFNFNKIEFLDISNILNLSLNELAIDISNNNIKIYHKSEVYDIKVYFSFFQEVLNLYLKKIIKIYDIKTIKLFGNNKNIQNICNYLEQKLKIKILIYSYPDTIPIKLLT